MDHDAIEDKIAGHMDVGNPIRCSLATGLFLLWGASIVIGIPLRGAYAAQMIEEMTASEKQAKVRQLLTEGDLYREMRGYNLASDTYEKVFLYDPKNEEASKKIDLLKRELLSEGRSDVELLTGMYDSETEMRKDIYWSRVEEHLARRQWGQARFTLEKILLLDPLNEEAETLQKRLNKAEEEGLDPAVFVEGVIR